MSEDSKNTSLSASASTEEKALAVAGWLEDKQAEEVVALDVRAINTANEAVVIATAKNVRHAQALADHVMAQMKESGLEMLGMEGHKTGQWILVDVNDVVVHIFQRPGRGFYNLEGLWSTAVVLHGAEYLADHDA